MGIKYPVNKDFFKTWSPDMSYVLGFIAADGSLEDASYLRGKYLRICSSEKDILGKIRRAMASQHTIVTVRPRVFYMEGKKYISKAQHMLRIGDHDIYNDLVALGITPKKSKTITLPKIPSSCLKDFFRGYFDGDGCVNFYEKEKRPSVIFTSGSEVFLKQLSDKIGMTVGVKTHSVFKSKRSFQLKYSTREAVSLLKYIYSDGTHALYLERKYLKFLDFTALYPQWRAN